MSSFAASMRQRDATISGRRPTRSSGIAAGSAGGGSAASFTALIACPRSGPAPTSAASWLRAIDDRVFVLRELGTHGGERGVRLSHFDPGVEAGSEALAGDADDVLALRECRQRNVALREQALQVEIRACDARRQCDACGLGVGRGALRLRQRAAQRRTVLVPEIELEAEVERCPRVGLPRAAERWRKDVILRVALIRRGAVAADLRQQRGARHACGGVGLGNARPRPGERRVAGEAFGDERIELHVAVASPPVIARPDDGGRRSRRASRRRPACPPARASRSSRTP